MKREVKDIMWRAFQFSMGDHIDMIAVGYNISAKNRWFAINTMFIGFDKSEKEPVYYKGRLCSGIEMAHGTRYRSEYNNLTRSQYYIEEQIEKTTRLPHGVIDDCLFHNFDKIEVCRTCGGAVNVLYDKDGYNAFWSLFHNEGTNHSKTMHALLSLDFTNLGEKYSILSKLGSDKHRLNQEYECDTCLRHKAQIKEQKANRLKEIKLTAIKELETAPEKNEDDYEYAPEPLKYLYLMKCNRNGLYKIGVSVSPKFREKTLCSEDPSIQLVGSWEGLSNNEREWHSYFAKHRVRGEWFNLTKTQVELFCRQSVKKQSAPNNQLLSA